MDKRQMIDMLADFYSNGNKSELARKLGVPQSRLSMWQTKNTFDTELIYNNFVEISSDWLLSGEGSMFRDEYKPRYDKDTRNRILAFCTLYSINMEDFEKETELTLEGIAKKYPNLNPNWLLYGAGDMFIHSVGESATDGGDADRYRKRVEELERLVEQKDRMLEILMGTKKEG